MGFISARKPLDTMCLVTQPGQRLEACADGILRYIAGELPKGHVGQDGIDDLERSRGGRLVVGHKGLAEHSVQELERLHATNGTRAPTPDEADTPQRRRVVLKDSLLAAPRRSPHGNLGSALSAPGDNRLVAAQDMRGAAEIALPEERMRALARSTRSREDIASTAILHRDAVEDDAMTQGQHVAKRLVKAVHIGKHSIARRIAALPVQRSRDGINLESMARVTQPGAIG